MALLKQLMEANNELDRLVDHWKTEGATLTNTELRDAVSHELEMLEYTPAHIKAVLPQLLGRIKPKK